MTVLDIDFEWPVDLNGYKIKSRTALTGGNIVRCGGKLKMDTPLKYFPTMFMEFAELDGEDESCLRFANKYGPLGLGLFPRQHDNPLPKARIKRGGERLFDWQDASKEMRRAVEIWRRDPRALCRGWDSKTKIVDLEVVLIPSPIDAMPLFRIQPRSLLGAMWLQFARVVTSPDLDVKACEQCGEWFEAGGERRRIDAKFCSDKCRDNFNNAKKRKAS